VTVADNEVTSIMEFRLFENGETFVEFALDTHSDGLEQLLGAAGAGVSLNGDLILQVFELDDTLAELEDLTDQREIDHWATQPDEGVFCLVAPALGSRRRSLRRRGLGG
jgi:hypothetical protein